MDIRRIRLEINGVVCGLITQESEEYMQALASEVGDMMKQILSASPFVTREAAALTAALSYCDDLKKAQNRGKELQDRVDELEVEAELWQEERSAAQRTPAPEDPALKEKLRELEERNTALEEIAAKLRELEERSTRLEDENASLRETGRNEARQEIQAVQEKLAQALRENEVLRAAAETAKEELEKAKQEAAAQADGKIEKTETGSTAAAGDDGKAEKTPQAKSLDGAGVTIRKNRKNPLRYEDELEQEGFVSFFEKK